MTPLAHRPSAVLSARLVRTVAERMLSAGRQRAQTVVTPPRGVLPYAFCCFSIAASFSIYSIQSVVPSSAFCFLFGCWQNHLHGNRWRLTGQRKHLVNSDPGPDGGIAQFGLANCFLHTLGSEFSHISQHRCKGLFSFCYAFCFAFSDAHDGVIAHAVAS